MVGAFLEFFGEGADSLSVGDRATIANMTPEYGATAGLFYIDQQTIDYLRLTGREDEQIALVEHYTKHAGYWSDTLTEAVYERVLKFDLSTVGRNLAGPSNPHALLPVSELASRGIAGAWQESADEMPDGAVIIAAITSCTNTSNPRNMVAAGLIARNANRLGLTRKPWVKSSLAPGSKTVKLYLEEANLLRELQHLGFDVVAFACTTCNGMSGALDPSIQQQVIDRDLYATAVLSGNRNFDGRIHPYAKQAFLASPPLVVAYAIAGTIRFDIEKDTLGFDHEGAPITLRDIWPADEEITRSFRPVSNLSSSGKSISPCLRKQRKAPERPVHSTTGVRSQPIFDGHPTGKGRWRLNGPYRECAPWLCCRTTSPPTICHLPTPSCRTAPPASIWPRWVCQKKTSTLMQRTGETI